MAPSSLPVSPWAQGAPSVPMAVGACSSVVPCWIPGQECILFGAHRLALQSPEVWEREAERFPVGH